MKQMAGQEGVWHSHFTIHPLGFLLFRTWLKLGHNLGETEAKSSNALLASYLSRNKISNKTKQAAD